MDCGADRRAEKNSASNPFHTKWLRIFFAGIRPFGTPVATTGLTLRAEEVAGTGHPLETAGPLSCGSVGCDP